MLFTPKLYNQCLKITEELMKNQIAVDFIEPVDPVKDGAPNYFEVIKNPQCFSSITKKLNEKQYKYVFEWKRDIQLIFSNCFLYNGYNSAYSTAAYSLENQFHRLCKTIPFSDTPIEWFNRINKMTKKIANLMAHPPTLDKQELKPAPEIRSMSTKDLQRLSRATLSLTTGNDTLQLIQLLNSFGASITPKGGELFINLHSLSPIALQAMSTFVHERFSEAF